MARKRRFFSSDFKQKTTRLMPHSGYTVLHTTASLEGNIERATIIWHERTAFCRKALPLCWYQATRSVRIGSPLTSFQQPAIYEPRRLSYSIAVLTLYAQRVVD